MASSLPQIVNSVLQRKISRSRAAIQGVQVPAGLLDDLERRPRTDPEQADRLVVDPVGHRVRPGRARNSRRNRRPGDQVISSIMASVSASRTGSSTDARTSGGVETMRPDVHSLGFDPWCTHRPAGAAERGKDSPGRVRRKHVVRGLHNLGLAASNIVPWPDDRNRRAQQRRTMTTQRATRHRCQLGPLVPRQTFAALGAHLVGGAGLLLADQVPVGTSDGRGGVEPSPKLAPDRRRATGAASTGRSANKASRSSTNPARRIRRRTITGAPE